MNHGCIMNDHDSKPKRWIPKAETLTLDGIRPDEYPLFRYILTRNGHNAALYGGFSKAEQDLHNRQRRFPMDDWAIIDREGEVR